MFLGLSVISALTKGWSLFSGPSWIDVLDSLPSVLRLGVEPIWSCWLKYPPQRLIKDEVGSAHSKDQDCICEQGFLQENWGVYIKGILISKE